MNQEEAPIKKRETKALRVLLIIVFTAILGLILWQSYRIALRTSNDQVTSQPTSAQSPAVIPILRTSQSIFDSTSTSSSSLNEKNESLNDAPKTVTSKTSITSASTTSAAPSAVPDSAPATTSTTTTARPEQTTIPAPTSVSAVEKEIFRLTNELRKNPTGPLKRQKNYLPSDCPSTESLSPLTLDARASQSLALDWSQQMGGRASQEIAGGSSIQQAGGVAMKHRNSEEQKKILISIGTTFSTWGENIAWASGYPSETIAKTLFEGWRESDGHYCGMMNPSFTHIGVGHYRDTQNGIDWATQNFYG